MEWPERVVELTLVDAEFGALGTAFQEALTLQAAEGYRLHSWRMTSVVDTDGQHFDTVMAVFARAEP